MAETPDAGAGRTGASTHDPGERGRLTVADRAVERIARRAAQDCPGVAATGTTLERAVGRGYPRVRARIAGRRARIEVEIAAEWPTPLPELTATVRREVAGRVGEYAGLRVDAVDVTAARVVRAPETAGRVE